MANISKINLPNNSTTYDIISKTGRGIVRCETDSSSTSTAFIVTVSGITSLYNGIILCIKNTKVKSAANCTINLNGLGAKRIWLSQSNSYCSTHWDLNTTYLFVYDATNERWELQQGRDTDNNTTYTFANGTNGFTVTPSGGTAQTVTVTPSITNNVTGNGTSGYIAKWNGTNTITNGPAFGSTTTTYLNNAGSWATPPDTKNTAGSTDTSSKIFLIGATSQAANPQTYSDNEVFATSGVLTTKSVQIGGGFCTLQYNSTTQSCDFIFT